MTTAVLLPPLNPMPHGHDETWMPRLIRRGVSKGVENGRRLASLRVARPQGVEGSGMARPGKTVGSPWIPLAIWAWMPTLCKAYLNRSFRFNDLQYNHFCKYYAFHCFKTVQHMSYCRIKPNLRSCFSFIWTSL